jgi:hypothetical protein
MIEKVFVARYAFVVLIQSLNACLKKDAGWNVHPLRTGLEI